MQVTNINKKKVKVKGRTYNMAHSPWATLVFLGPAVAVILLVVIYPLTYEINISFRNITLYNVLSGNYPFIAFKNYIDIFSSSAFYTVFLRTLIWTFSNVFFHVSLGLFLAILLNRKLPGKTLIRTILILPWAIPQYIVALTWKSMFNVEYGAINILLGTLVGHKVAIPWLTDPNITFIACIITNIWLGVPFMMMICLGGLQSIPQELYEAADVDGATSLQKFRNITFPSLKPILTPAIILGTVWTFNQINVIYIMTSGINSDATQILVTQVYRRAFESYQFGYAAAFSIIIFLFLMCFSSFFIKSQKLDD